MSSVPVVCSEVASWAAAGEKWLQGHWRARLQELLASSEVEAIRELLVISPQLSPTGTLWRARWEVTMATAARQRSGCLGG
jgi:hypothetical protein